MRINFTAKSGRESSSMKALVKTSDPTKERNGFQHWIKHHPKTIARMYWFAKGLVRHFLEEARSLGSSAMIERVLST